MFRAKAAVFSLSLLFSLCAGEIFLRLAGLPRRDEATYASVPPYDDPVEEPDLVLERYRTRETARPVLLLGDSYTAGDNVRTYHSYPYFLFEGLRNSRGKAAVLNLGRADATTASAAAALTAVLRGSEERQSPEAVVILVGANDPFLAPRAETDGNEFLLPWADILPESRFKSLRLYQAWRRLKTSLLLRSGLLEHYDDETPMLEQQEKRLNFLLGIYRSLREAGVSDANAALPPEHAAAIRREALKGEYDVYDIAKVSGFASFLVELANIVYTSRDRRGELSALLLELSRDYPKSFWSGEIEHAGRYLIQTCLQQEDLQSGEILKSLEAAAQRAPAIRGLPSFSNFYDYLKNPEEHGARLRLSRLRAWEKIARLSREKGFKVVVMNYPQERPEADAELAAAAARHGFAFVDNRERFSRLVQEYGLEPFVGEIDHLTPDGYKELAAGVLRAL